MVGVEDKDVERKSNTSLTVYVRMLAGSGVLYGRLWVRLRSAAGPVILLEVAECAAVGNVRKYARK